MDADHGERPAPRIKSQMRSGGPEHAKSSKVVTVNGVPPGAKTFQKTFQVN